MKKKKQTKRKKRKDYLGIIITLLFTILSSILIFNIIKLANIETFLRGIIIIVLILLFILLTKYRKKKKIIFNIIIIILCILYIFLNYTFYKVYNSLNNITKNVETKGICLVYNKEGFNNLDALKKGNIAMVGEKMDSQFYSIATEIIKTENIKNELTYYEDYFQIINALLNNEINYAFLPENYNDIYVSNSGKEAEYKLPFSVLYTKQKLVETKNEITSTKALTEPFTVLLMGSDVLVDSYNADTLMVLSVNPKTLKVTMLSIPRDTYTTIACTGGKHKINSSGWYGDSCVVKTVQKYLGVDIDYYAKINFLGIVELVDALNGIEVDVPYSLCEQNSKRKFGADTVYVDEGLQTLNGEQALALSRNRHYYTGWCPKKYTTDGERNDFTRGANQQLVIKAIIAKLMTVRDVNTFYKLLDTIGNNMTTNMPKDTILSLYNVGKNIVKRLSASETDEIINIERLKFKSRTATVRISGLDLSMVINSNESLKYITNQMKQNLGLIKVTPITNFSMDINEEYDVDSVNYNKTTYSLSTLNNLVGKTLKDAKSYCSNNGLKCISDSTDDNAIVISQSIAPNTDLTTIRNKTITLGVESKNTVTPPPITKPEDNTSKEETEDKEEDKEEDKTPSEEEKEEPPKQEEPTPEEDNKGDDETPPPKDETPEEDNKEGDLSEEA